MNSIPFELHLTIHGLLTADIEHFVSCCTAQEAKPMMIELSRGTYIHQPMMNKVVITSSLQEALMDATMLSGILQTSGFPVKRLKIEVPADQFDAVPDMSANFTPYFEWHGKVMYDNVHALLECCATYQVHLSRNALKQEQTTRFVTLREFGDINIFQQRINKLSAALNDGGWTVIKQQSEYCIYDNNIILDGGWLTQ
ncbi:hypothetical protein [Chitinophaga pinensis]|uniref:Uncharacterized protein n=1 Tax=Chitinophaga pinensis (strain ATCC 43595 / DSM 2588 / LMG 13176 / NBRC 15968 / NCIMB 11800 / UQM 2034) TaxID=485918 RepID=A0A979GSV3_CHIPD|nr:hypothetical protein [Chitinophaga pinensis]ACU63322.1 conserved hypothetical protein [Chitinophaga pinensis DSM 2588]